MVVLRRKVFSLGTYLPNTLKMLLSATPSSDNNSTSWESGGCIDFGTHSVVRPGEFYQTESCQSCLCTMTEEKSCVEIFCAPPQHCDGQLRRNSMDCCDVCDTDYGVTTYTSESLSVKMGALTVVLFLLMFLLFFGWYRLRKKRALLSSLRRLNDGFGGGHGSCRRSRSLDGSSLTVESVAGATVQPDGHGGLTLNGYPFPGAPPTYQEAVGEATPPVGLSPRSPISAQRSVTGLQQPIVTPVAARIGVVPPGDEPPPPYPTYQSNGSLSVGRSQSAALRSGRRRSRRQRSPVAMAMTLGRDLRPIGRRTELTRRQTSYAEEDAAASASSSRGSLSSSESSDQCSSCSCSECDSGVSRESLSSNEVRPRSEMGTLRPAYILASATTATENTQVHRSNMMQTEFVQTALEDGGDAEISGIERNSRDETAQSHSAAAVNTNKKKSKRKRLKKLLFHSKQCRRKTSTDQNTTPTAQTATSSNNPLQTTPL